MSNNYFLVPASIAKRCASTSYRYGNEDAGYLLSSSEAEVIPKKEIMEAGGKIMTHSEAAAWVKKFRKQNKI